MFRISSRTAFVLATALKLKIVKGMQVLVFFYKKVMKKWFDNSTTQAVAKCSTTGLDGLSIIIG